MARLFSPGTLFWTIAGNAHADGVRCRQPLLQAEGRRGADRAGRRAISQHGAGRVPERRRRAARAAGRCARDQRGGRRRGSREPQHRSGAPPGRTGAGVEPRACSMRSKPICKLRSPAFRRRPRASPTPSRSIRRSAAAGGTETCPRQSSNEVRIQQVRCAHRVDRRAAARRDRRRSPLFAVPHTKAAEVAAVDRRRASPTRRIPTTCASAPSSCTSLTSFR